MFIQLCLHCFHQYILCDFIFSFQPGAELFPLSSSSQQMTLMLLYKIKSGAEKMQ